MANSSEDCHQGAGFVTCSKCGKSPESWTCRPLSGREGVAGTLVWRGETAQFQMSITKERRTQLISDFKRGADDSGSPEVQIAILSSRILTLTEHLQTHRKDFASRRGLLRMVSRRRRLLDYVKRVDPQRYLDILKRLKLRK